jgi:hypothetical protein
MAWQHRLPDGVRHEGGLSQGFTLGVSLPVGEDGLAPLQCPVDAGHRFKVPLIQGASGESSDCYCPYRGARAATDEFLADQMPRLTAAMEAAAEQYAHQFGQVIGVFVAAHRDAKAAGRFFEQAIGTTKVTPLRWPPTERPRIGPRNEEAV